MRAFALLLTAACATAPHPWTAAPLPPGSDEVVVAAGVGPLRGLDVPGLDASAAWRHGFERFELAGAAAWEGLRPYALTVGAEGRTSLHGGDWPLSAATGLEATFGGRTILSPGAAITFGHFSPSAEIGVALRATARDVGRGWAGFSLYFTQGLYVAFTNGPKGHGVWLSLEAGFDAHGGEGMLFPQIAIGKRF